MHLLLSLVILAAPADSGVAPSPAPAPRPVTFEYDVRQPLDIKDMVIAETPELAIHDLSFASANQQRAVCGIATPDSWSTSD